MGFSSTGPILYLDEPTVSLDVPSAHRAARDVLGRYARATAHKTVLITSHNALDLQICDRILLLHQGRVVAVGTMDELQGPAARDRGAAHHVR